MINEGDIIRSCGGSIRTYSQRQAFYIHLSHILSKDDFFISLESGIFCQNRHKGILKVLTLYGIAFVPIYHVTHCL